MKASLGPGGWVFPIEGMKVSWVAGTVVLKRENEGGPADTNE